MAVDAVSASALAGVVLVAVLHTAVGPDHYLLFVMLAKLVRRVFPLSPQGIIDHLKLRQPVYRETAACGHFGRKGFAWERVDATQELLARAKKI